MVKGINKNVIEIVDTGNDMFERAILFIRPGGAEQGEEQLHAGARRYLSGLRFRRRILTCGRQVHLLLKYGSALAVGATAAAMALYQFCR